MLTAGIPPVVDRGRQEARRGKGGHPAGATATDLRRQANVSSNTSSLKARLPLAAGRTDTVSGIDTISTYCVATECSCPDTYPMAKTLTSNPDSQARRREAGRGWCRGGRYTPSGPDTTRRSRSPPVLKPYRPLYSPSKSMIAPGCRKEPTE